MDIEAVVVDRLKWPVRPHRSVRAQHVDTDSFGRWLGIRAGDDLGQSRGYEWARTHDAVLLVPTSGWWMAYWSTYGTIYIDVALVRARSAERIVAVDLDLDVTVSRTGEVVLEDVDDFARHVVDLAYPQWLVNGALGGVSEIMSLLSAKRAPFDGVTANRHLQKFVETTTAPVDEQ